MSQGKITSLSRRFAHASGSTGARPDAAASATSAVYQVANGEGVYDAATRMVLLESDHGMILARYVGVAPPKAGERLYVVIPARSRPLFYIAIPPIAPPELSWIAWPFGDTIEPRLMTHAEGDAASATPSAQDVQIMGPGDVGVRIGTNSVTIGGPQGGLRLDVNGLGSSGTPTQEGSTERGLSKESALFGLIPKTAVTFWFADYLPNLREIMRILETAQRLQSSIVMVMGINKTLSEFRKLRGS